MLGLLTVDIVIGILRKIPANGLAIFTPLLLLTAACTDHKQTSFSGCYKEHVAYYLPPRPQGSPPNEILILGLNTCMMSHGYRVNSEATSCNSPQEVNVTCFGMTPLVWLDAMFK